MPASRGAPIAIGLKPCLLLGEGQDDKGFFEGLVKHLSLDNVIQVEQAGGKNNLSSTLDAFIKHSGYPAIRVLSVIRDADNDADNAFQSVQSALAQNHLTVPASSMILTQGGPSTSIIILPGNNRPGMLEDLCLDAIVDDPSRPCIDQYFECLNQNNIQVPSGILSKAKIRTFLASRNESDLVLGRAAIGGHLPWDHAAFKPLRDHLQELAAAATSGD